MFQQLKNRTDSEHEQVLIRVGLAIFALVFLLISYQVSGDTQNRTEVLTAALFYLAFSIALTVVMWFDPLPSPSRRLFGITIDMLIVTYALTITGHVGAPLYGGYLWAIIANGFRFGKNYLYFAQALAVVGFSYVIATGDFWHEYPMFGAGLLIWLVVIPPYVSILLNRLSVAVSQAKRADMAKTHFLANMSHELRTPLNAIIGYSEILGDEMHEQGQDEYTNDLKNIHSAGTHLLGLINEVLDLSKIEEGRMDVLYEDINIPELATDVLTTIQPMAEKNANQLHVEVMPTITTVRTDVTKLRQVLFNLLSNACKFTKNGHITLAVQKKTADDESCLEFNVSDDGIGIAPEKIESIFKPFRQESLTTSKEYGGTGLGLALSKRFCELMGGQLLVKSSKGEGSTFTVLLPLSSPASNLGTPFQNAEDNVALK
jgi:two-component system sensor histidine kinase RpfC